MAHTYFQMLISNIPRYVMKNRCVHRLIHHATSHPTIAMIHRPMKLPACVEEAVNMTVRTTPARLLYSTLGMVLNTPAIHARILHCRVMHALMDLWIMIVPGKDALLRVSLAHFYDEGSKLLLLLFVCCVLSSFVVFFFPQLSSSCFYRNNNNATRRIFSIIYYPLTWTLLV